MVRLIGLLKLDSYFFSNGFGYIYIQCVHNSRAFLSAFVNRLKDHYLQSWYAELADSSKRCLYKDYTLYYEHEAYLNCLNIRTFGHTLSKFRSGCHNLEIEDIMVFQDMTDYADCVRMKLKMKFILCFSALYMKL